MSTWTNIDDTFLEPGKPVRSVDGLALRDNPIAIAEGASGAPRIVNDAVTNGTLGAEKFQTGTTERDWVLARTATASVGSVGSYAMLAITDGGASMGTGSTQSGSLLVYSDSTGSVGTSSPAGTWRNMSRPLVAGGSAGIFLRIA